MDIDTKVTQFLLDVNKRLDGIVVFEDKEFSRKSFLKFQLELTSPHINSACFWSPSSLGQKIVEDTIHKHFDIYQEVGWNNTRTILWFTDKGERND